MKLITEKTEIQGDVVAVHMVTNDTKEQMAVLVKPWADEFVLMPEESIEIHVVDNFWDVVSTDCKPGCLVVWLWNGCRARVYREGCEVTLNSFTHTFSR